MKPTRLFIYSAFLVLLTIFCIENARAEANWLVEKQRIIQKTAPLNTHTEVVIDNQYGDVQVGLWDKKEVKIVITIKANGTTDEKALEYLDDVKIVDSKDGNKLIFKTEIDSKGSNWNSLKSLSNAGKNYLRIDYHVTLPSQTTLAIHNKFGGIRVPDYEGVLTIDSRYGDFKGGVLHHRKCNIKVSYGSGEIDHLHGGELDIRYSNFTVAKLGDVQMTNKYGKLSIGEVRDLVANFDYSGVSIGKITNSGVIKVNYSGKFKIAESKAELLDIKAAYSTVELPVMPADYAVTVSFGNFKYPTNREFMIKEINSSQKPGNQTRTFEGYIGGRPNQAHVVKVTSRFGDVRLTD